ncbi:MAG: adenylate/guanylate cyclase domain-containing protein [Spirochaetota bacterium]
MSRESSNIGYQNLTEFLQEHPWENHWLEKAQPVDYLWNITLPVNAEDLWVYLTDTSTTNQALGLAKMHFTEKEGRLFGSSVNLGIPLEWEEVPWTWDYATSLESARIYSKGFAQYVRAIYRLFPQKESLKLYIYFGWIPKGLFSRWLLKLSMPQIKKKYNEYLQNLAKTIGKNKTSQNMLLQESKVGYLSEEQKDRLTASLSRIEKKGFSHSLSQKILQYINTQADENMYRIRPIEVAKHIEYEQKEVIRFFIHACKESIFNISWDLVCPHCRGVRDEIKHLGEIPNFGSCDVCEIEFDADQINSLEITFHIHPSIRDVEKVFYCSAEPAKKPHILSQISIPTRKTIQLSTKFPEGRYRFRIKGDKNYDFLDVQKTSDAGELYLSNKVENQTHTVKEQPLLVLKNTDTQDRTFIIEKDEEDQYSLRPKDLFLVQDFHDLFSEEAIATGMSLDVGIQTILFTDIVGSTRLYAEEGDGGAFQKVKEHFVTIYEYIQSNNGAVVKTIGDAAMAVFPTPLEALQAAIKLQENFSSANPTGLRIRISLHTGPCLTVKLNSNIDYFGNTVNYAAKLQTTCDAGEISFSEESKQNPLMKDFLQASEYSYKEIAFQLSGANEENPVFRMHIS